MNDQGKINWNNYIISFCPIFLIFYISNEAYAIDFRAFYLAGKSILNNLNPYLNHVSLDIDFYGPINSELSKYSGWKYPPLASYLFVPFATLPYELSKNLFNLISLLSGSLITYLTIKKKYHEINPSALLIVGISFPLLATISRGQVEVLLLCLALISLYFFRKGNIILSSITLAVIGFVKIFPLLLSISFIKSKKRIRFLLFLILSLVILYFLNNFLCPIEWRQTFLERLFMPRDQIPMGDLKELPKGIGVIKDSMMVRTSDARDLFHSHFFVFGFANPLLYKNILMSGIFGVFGALIIAIKFSKYSLTLTYFAVMNWINIINPISWIMGLIWYIPLFIYSYDKVKKSFKFIIILPLILPPFLNISGYAASIISLFIINFFSNQSLKSFTLRKSLTD